MIKINQDKAVRRGLVFIWTILIIVCIITFIDPNWLASKSLESRRIESAIAFRAGKKMQKKNDYRKALKIFMDAEYIDENNIDAILGQAETFVLMGNREEALATYLRGLEKNMPNKHLLYYPLAELYYNLGNFTEAGRYFKIARSTDTFQVHSLNKTGEMYVFEKDWDNALLMFKQVIENSGSLKYFYLDEMKKELIRFANNKKVSEDIKKLIRKSITDKELNNYDTVLFNRFIRTDQNLAVTYNQIGYVYIAKKDMENAEKSFRAALSIWPDFTPAYKNLNMLLKEKGDTVSIEKKLTL